MYADDTDALARESALVDIRAFLAAGGLRQEALAPYINGLSKRHQLDIATTRRLFVAEVKKQARERQPWRSSEPERISRAEDAWRRRETAEYPKFPEPDED